MHAQNNHFCKNDEKLKHYNQLLYTSFSKWNSGVLFRSDLAANYKILN